MSNWLWLTLVCVLTIYAPVELTRIIVNDALIAKLWEIPAWQFLFEIGLLWIAYIAGLFLVRAFGDKRLVEGEKDGRESNSSRDEETRR